MKFALAMALGAIISFVLFTFILQVAWALAKLLVFGLIVFAIYGFLHLYGDRKP